MSNIPCMMMVSGFSGLLQRMLKSHRIKLLSEPLSKNVTWTGNSSEKVSIIVGCLVGSGARWIVEEMYGLFVTSSLTLNTFKNISI